MDREALTPAQRRVVDDLLWLGRPRPSFGAGLDADLRGRLEEALAPLAEGLTDELRVSKGALARVHACEANYVAEQGWPGWNLANCEGEVTHRAVQLSVALDHDTTPLELVDHAIEATAGDAFGSLGEFLRGQTPAARGELRARAVNAVSTFLECWPSIPASWWPRTELAVRADLCGGRIVLSGKVDLCLGRAAGSEARCLFVDLKTGGRYPAHLDDLRFYALVQTLRIGVPPFRVASYYLDSATFVAEEITTETLEVALLRTYEGVRKMCELRAGGRRPAVTPNPRCRYCPIRAGCDGARQWEEARSDHEGV